MLSTQDPNGAAGAGDANVAYAWDYGLDGDAASHARVEKVTLPGEGKNGSELFYMLLCPIVSGPL